MSLQTYPMISVVVPVYNAENYLENSIKLFLLQTYPNLEFVLVDDGSKDKSGSICDEYASKDSRISVIHKVNGGASDARNVGIDNAKGELICFADSDDELHEDYVNDLYSDFIKYPDTDLVIQGFLQKWPTREHPFIMSDGHYLVTSDGMKNFFSNVFINDFSGPYCKLLCRRILDKYNIRYSKNIIYGEDFDFLLRYIPHARSITTSSKSNYFYIMHDGSVSSKIYSFDRELSSINQLGGSFQSLRTIFDSEHLRQREQVSLSAYVRRLISANYQYGYSMKKRIAHFKQINPRFIEMFVCMQERNTVFMSCVKVLMRYRLFTLLDILLFYRLVLRK